MNFLSNDSLIGRITGRIWDVVLVNILFIICSIPIFTIGASYTAMYYAMLKLWRYGDSSVLRDFFRGFKDNFKRATLIWICVLMMILIFFADLGFFKEMGGTIGQVGYLISAAAGACILIILFYLFPVLASFENTLTNLIRHALYFAVSSIPNLLMICFANIFPMMLTFSDLAMFSLYTFIWCFFGFGLVAYFNSFLLIKQFNKFLPPVLDPNEIIPDSELLHD